MKPFKSSYVKLERGLEHLKTLHEQFRADYKAKPLETEIRLEERLKGGVAIAYLVATQLPDLPPERSAVIGDVVANFRAALDHAVWRLVRIHGAKLNPVEQRRVQFPLATSAKSFKAQFGDRLPGVPFAGYGTFLKRFQPYRRTEEGWTMRLLRQVSDRDKHRVVTLSYVSPSAGKVTFNTTGCKVIGNDPAPAILRRLEVGTPIARIYVLPTSPNPSVSVKANLTLSPTFERGMPVLESLLNMARICAHLVEQIEHAALSRTPPHPETPVPDLDSWARRGSKASGSS